MLETLSLMGMGFIHAMNPLTLVLMIGATALGITIGCLPGLSAAMGVALLLPVTFGMDQATGLIVLGGIFGGSISAILIHTPGTPASAATAIEGYELTKKGLAAKALAVACFASFCGGLLSCISLYFFSPFLAELAMKFKSPEYFWLSIFGLTVIAGVSSKSLLKGFISGILGLLISTIGMDPMEGVERFMMGSTTLYNGVNVTCALIGLFSMSQVLILAEKAIKKRAKAAKFTGSLLLSRSDIKRLAPTITRSWIIGNILGILPGAGATIACFMGYNEARRFSKHKDEFGKGSIDGVAGSEAANNAVTGATLIPLLTLGIPGDGCVAIMLSALMINGLRNSRVNGRFDYSRSAAGSGTVLDLRSDDLYILCRFRACTVCDARRRSRRLPYVCSGFPPFRLHSDSFHLPALRCGFFRYSQQLCGSDHHVHFRHHRLLRSQV